MIRLQTLADGEWGDYTDGTLKNGMNSADAIPTFGKT
jgi:hypothetical protein